jgi:hypothetical protein
MGNQTERADRYQAIRDALAKGPTSGRWWKWAEGKPLIVRCWDNQWWPIASVEGFRLGWHENRDCEGREAGANAAHIAACHPAAIRSLLAERDALLAALSAFTEYSAEENGGASILDRCDLWTNANAAVALATGGQQ